MKNIKIGSLMKLAVIYASMLILLCSCGEKDPLVGTWYNTQKPDETMVFTDDGHYTIGDSTVKYVSTGSYVSFEKDGTTIGYSYTLEDDTLTLISDERNYVFKRLE